MRKCSGSNEKGLTLVEVLAALVILGILFVGIMTIFPQMTLFNEKTEAKLDTMNLARQEMATITAQDLWKRQYNSLNGEAPNFLSESEIESKLLGLSYTVNAGDPGTSEYKRFYNTGSSDYLYIADVYLECEAYQKPDPAAPPPSASSCAQQDIVKLHKVHLQVLLETQPGSGTYRLSSETFSFIPYKETDIN
ncbi:PulJ/GspJ family protein [Planomicrobium okeanokoites]|uniref:Type II secretion system protein J n=1 Tax=Planomicrobium okeanokoites TaxID=244 RepID=A0ABV7KQU7_PLAOK|nr:type II secretion system protein [Planomicrobium okeanokoites]